jgi:hypothetical protein
MPILAGTEVTKPDESLLYLMLAQPDKIHAMNIDVMKRILAKTVHP